MAGPSVTGYQANKQNPNRKLFASFALACAGVQYAGRCAGIALTAFKGNKTLAERV